MKTILYKVCVVTCFLLSTLITHAQTPTSITYTFKIDIIDHNLITETKPNWLYNNINTNTHTTQLPVNSKDLIFFENTSNPSLGNISIHFGKHSGQLFLAFIPYADGNAKNRAVYNLSYTKARLRYGSNILKLQVQNNLIYLTCNSGTDASQLIETNQSGEGMLRYNDMSLFTVANRVIRQHSISDIVTTQLDYATSTSRFLTPTTGDDDYIYYEYGYDNNNQTDQLGSGLAFDGVTDNVSVSNTTTASFTLETYIKTSANSLTGTNAFQGNGLLWSDVAGVANDFTLAVLNNKISFFDGSKNGGVTGNKVINDGFWHHVAVTRQAGGSIFIYIDGVLDASTTAGSATLSANPSIKIGGNTLENKYFYGYMDEIRIWNTARSQANIQASMNNELDGTETGLIAYYNCNQGIACSNNDGITTLQDNSGHSNTGTLNFDYSNTIWNWVGGCNPTTYTKVCYGMTVQLSNANSGGSWSSSNTSIATVNQSTGKVSAVFPGVVNIIYTYPTGGCTNKAVTSLTVNPLPIITISGKSNICKGESTVLTASLGEYFYWNTGDNTQSITVSGAEDYNVIAYDNNGCSGVGYKTITEKPLPSADWYTVYGYTAYTFYSKAPFNDITHSYTWKWYYDHTLVPNQFLAHYDLGYLYDPKKVGLQVKDNTTGCSNTRNVSGTSDSHDHVQDIPLVTASATSVCVGTAVTLQTPQVADFYYVWSTNADGTGVVGFDTTIAVTPNITTTYFVIAVDKNGHTSNPSGVTITVNDWSAISKNTGNALKFDGSNDYVNLGASSAFNITNAITLEAWVKVHAFTIGWQAIITKGDNSWRLSRYQESNFVGFSTTGLSNVDLGGTTNINDGKWHHIAGVFDGTKKYIYVDGKLDASVTVTGTIATSTYPVNIGYNAQRPGVRYFNGTIDEVRIWNVAKTQTQIQFALSKELAGTEPGLVAYYNFNQGIANGSNTNITSLRDNTINSNNGTLTDFGLSGTTSNWVAGTSFGTNPATTNQLSFDGTNDYISVANNQNIPVSNSTYTLEAMVKPTIHATNGIIGWGNWGSTNATNALRLGTGNTIHNYWWSNDFSVTSANLADGAWHHVAATFDGTTRKIYVDGVLKGQDNPTGHNVVNTSNLAIGVTNSSEYFKGSMDEVRVWNIARSQAQILNNLNSELSTNDTTGLVVYYSFNQGTSGGNNSNITKLLDNSPSRNNGTLNNFALVGNESNWVTDNTVGTATVTICTDTTFQLNNAATGGIWSSSNNSVATVNGVGLVTRVSNGSAIIDYTLANANGCIVKKTTTVTVGTPTIADIMSGSTNWSTAGYGPTLSCCNNNYNFTNATPGGIWSSSNPAVATINSSGVVTTKANGSTTISYTVVNSGCSASRSIVAQVSTFTTSKTLPVKQTDSFLTKIDILSSIQIFPNPAHDKVTVQLPEEMEKATISIIDILGTTVAIDKSIGLQRVINLSGKSNGIYLVKILSKDGTIKIQKLIVQ